MKCPKCGLENRSGVRFCRQCGQTLPVAPPATSSLAVAACPTCGAATKPQARFCKQCGQALPVAPFAPPHAAACPDCGAAVKLGARFCPKCGRRLTAKSAPPAAPPSLPPADVDVHIEGGVSGQVAIGNNIIQIGDVHGGVVNVAMPEEKPQIRPRPTPVSLIPRPFPGLLDREPEVDAATAALQSALRQDTAAPVEFYGHAGMGKTSLLRHLAHRSAADAFPDGVVYLSANQPSEDILQSIYDAFYKCDISFKPTEGQIRQSLQGRRALFILDDVELARDEVEALMNAAPTCTFLLGSPERRLWGEGRAMELDGLPPDDALTLVERELDRPLASAERAAARNLCAMLEGHPLRILQATATAREKGLSLTEAARQIQTPSPAATLTAQVLASLSEQGRILLAAMAALGDAPVHAQHLGEITGIPNVTPILQTLQQRGLAQAHSPRYNLTGDLAQTLQQTWDLDPWAERALAHFTTWAEGQQQAPDRLLEEADALLQVLEQAVQTKRWENVLRLGRAVEGALAVGKRWGAWAQVLRWILQAAQALGEQAAQSWALHQLGSRALCLGDTSAARTALTKALRLREALGDKAGAAITKHNLKLLLAPPTPPKKKPPKKPPQPPSTPAAATGVPALIKGAIALVAASLLALGGVGTWYFFLRPTPTPAPVEVTATPLPTLRPTPTSPPPTEAPPVEEPWVSIELVDGCGREYVRDDYTTLRVETNIESRVEIWLDDTIFEEVWLSPGEVWEIEWTFENLQSGSHALWAVLFDVDDDDDDEASGAECPFDVAPPTPTPVTPTWTPTITPSPTPSITPSPTPQCVCGNGICDSEYPCDEDQYNCSSDCAESPSSGLDHTLDPKYGSMSMLSACPDPDPVNMVSGGPIDVSTLYLGSGCGGYTTSAASFRLQWSGSSNLLRIYFVADTEGEDTTLIVNDPYANWHCDDDSYNSYDPLVEIPNPSNGQYDIWVGSYSSSDYVKGTLYIRAGCLY